ncbi:MAG TPA: DNA-directed RNA polymerase subunit omega [Chthoniobacterales bacterium]|nr:DNA-directed RNA polymerase subunit omega [Chthoniobacterales bacterium]
MKSELLTAAAKVIPDQGVLVNVMSLRVRQLASGHRPLVVHAPGMACADIALSEIIAKKLTFLLTPGENSKREPQEVKHWLGSPAPALKTAA